MANSVSTIAVIAACLEQLGDYDDERAPAWVAARDACRSSLQEKSANEAAYLPLQDVLRVMNAPERSDRSLWLAAVHSAETFIGSTGQEAS